MRTAPRFRLNPIHLGLLMCGLSASVTLANPTGGSVVHGQATINSQGSLLTVTTTTPKSIIDWQTFSIAPSETTRFVQPSSSSSVLNRVLANEPSALLGSLQSNGKVFLINPYGILVGEGASIDVGGFVASTLNLGNQDFLNNSFNFQATPNAGKVNNQGGITTPFGGSVYLIAPEVENSGIIKTPGGETILAAGQTVTLVDTGTPGVSVEITGSNTTATNLGKVIADAGTIGMAGALVTQAGTLNASSVVKEGGRIFLRASQAATLEQDSVTEASGTKGGDIRVIADEQVSVHGTLKAEGGGFIETSAAHVDIADAKVSAGQGGQWLIDPTDVTIDAAAASTIVSSLDSGTNVTVQTTGTAGDGLGSGNITVSSAITKTAGADATLTLSAHNNIQVNANITSASNKLNLNLYADSDATGGGSTTVSSGRTIDANGGTTTITGGLNLSGGTLANTMLTTATGATVTSTGSATLNNVTLDANLSVSTGNSLTLLNGLTFANNHTLTLNGGSSLFFSGTQTIGGTGEIIFGGTSGFNYIYPTASSTTLTIGPNVTVHSGATGQSANFDGNGASNNLTNISYVNEGIIDADASGKFINLYGNWDNNGTIKASAGTLQIWDNWTTANLGTWLETGTGAFAIRGSLDNTSNTLYINNTTGSPDLYGTILGGTVNIGGSATLYGQGLLDGVILIGNTTVPTATALTIQNGLTLNSGSVTLAGNAASLNFSGSQTIGGTGEIIFGGTSGFNYIYPTASSTTLTIGPNVTVHSGATGQSANFDGNGASNNLTNISYVNEGIIDADASGKFINLYGNWDNNGTIKASAGTLQIWDNWTTANLGTLDGTGGAIYLRGILDNTGHTLDIGTNGQFGPGGLNTLYGTIKNGTLIAGADNKTLVSSSGTLDNVTIGSNLNESGTLQILGNLTLADGIDFNVGGSALQFASVANGINLAAGATSATLTHTGSLTTNSSNNNGVTTIGSGVTVQGSGALNQTLPTGGWVNNGTILNNTTATLTINPTNFTNNGLVSATSSGAVSFSGANLTQAGTMTNSGTGTFTIAPTTAWTNSGSITNSSGTLTLNAASGAAKITNSGTLALDGGTLNLGGSGILSDVLQSGGFSRAASTTLNFTGTLDLENSATPLDIGTNGQFGVGGLGTLSGTIKNGTLIAGADNKTLVSSSGKLDNVTIGSNLNESGTLQILGNLTLADGIDFNVGGSALQFASVANGINLAAGATSATLTHTGSLTTNSSNNNGVTTIGSGVTVQGSGALNQTLPTGGWVNNGTILNNTTATLTINPTNFTNNGLVSATSTGAINFSPSNFTNNGTVSTSSAAAINITTGNPINNGTLRTTNGTITIAPAPTWTNAGLIEIGAGANVILDTTFQAPNNGYTGANLVNNGVIRGEGTLNLGYSNIWNGTGYDYYLYTLTNNGAIDPGFGANDAGTLTIKGNLVQGAGGTLHVDLGGTGAGQYDKFVFTGIPQKTATVQLGGTLEIAEGLNGFYVELGHAFPNLLTVDGSLSGTFASVTTPSDVAFTLNQTGTLGITDTTQSITRWATDNSGDWGTAANWTRGVPTSMKDAVVSRASASPTITVSSGTHTPHGLVFDEILEIAGGTLTLPNTFAGFGAGGNLVMSGGELVNPVALNFDGTLNWTSGTINGAGSINLGASGVLNKSGTGDLIINQPFNSQGTINVLGGTLDLAGGGSNTGAVTNVATLYLDAGTYTSLFTNQGVMTTVGATFTQLFTNEGTLTIDPGTTTFSGGFLQNSGALVLNGGEAAGTMQFNGGLLKGSGTITGNTTFNAATLTPGFSPGTITIVGDLTLNPLSVTNIEIAGTGAGQFDVIDVTGNVTMDGTLNVSLLTFTPSNGDFFPFLLATGTRSGTFATVNAPGNFNVGYSLSAGEAARLIYSISSTNTFTNGVGGLTWETAGNWSQGWVPIATDDVLISAGYAVGHSTGTDTISTLTINSGNSLNVSGGSLTVSGLANIGGTLTVSGGSVALNDTSTIAGLTLSSGSITGTGNITATGITWSGGTLSGTGTLTTSAASAISSGGGTLQKDWTSNGTVTLSGSTSLLPAGGKTFTNAGTFNYDSTNGIGSGGTFANSGTLNKNAAGTQTISGTFNNTGTLNVNAGTLDIPALATNNGNIEVVAGTTFQRTGAFTNNGTITGAGTINIGAGNTLTNNGTLAPGIATGDSTGTLSITGHLLQGATGILNIELAGTGAGLFDVINVTGNVTMDGTLNASLQSFTPSNNDFFSFLLATGTRSGTFATVNAPGNFNVGYSLAAGEAARLIYALGGANTFTNGVGGLTWETPGNWSFGTVPISTDDVLISAGYAVGHSTGTDTIATLTINSGNSLNVSGGSLTVSGLASVDGALTVSGGSVALNETSSIANLNLSSGSLSGAGNVSVSGPLSWTGGTIQGSGSFTTTGTSTLSTASTKALARAWANNGTATLSAGTLDMNSGASIGGTGTFTVSGGTLNVNDNVTVANLVLASGTLNTGGVGKGLTVSDDFNWDHGLITGGGSFNVTGNAVFANTVPGANAMLLSSQTLTIQGDLSIGGQYWLDMTNGQLTVNGATTIDTSAASGFYGINSPSSVSSVTFLGGLTKTGGAQAYDIANVNVTAAGTVQNQAGGDLVFDLDSLRNATLNNVSFVADSGTLIKLASGNYTVNGNVEFNGAGTTQIGNSDSRMPVFTVPSGNTATVNGNLVLTTNATLDFSDSLNIAGTFNWDGGLLTGAGATITVGTGGTMTLTGGGDRWLDGIDLVNNGTFNLNLDPGNYLIFASGANILNNGQFNIVSTSIPFSEVPTGTGVLDAESGGIFTNNGTLTKSGTGVGYIVAALNNNNVVTASAGYLVLEAIEGNSNHTSGTFNGSEGVIEFNGTHAFNGTNIFNGNITLSGGQFNGAGNIINNGTFDIQTDTNLSPVFANNGTLMKSYGEGNATFSSSFANAGEILAYSGWLDFAGGLTQSSGSIQLNDGNISGNLVLNGGLLGGSGMINGNVTVNAGTLSPGFSPGNLTIIGDLVLGPLSVTNIEIADGGEGPWYDVINVLGNVSLDGTLNVTLLNFTPNSGDSFPFLFANSSSGTFEVVNAPIGFNVGYNLDENEVARLIYSLDDINVFTNGFGGLTWQSAGNWSQGRVPILTDEVLISSGYAVSHSTGNDSIFTLTINSGNSLDVSGGSLTVSGLANVGGTLTVSGGSVTLNGLSTIADLTLSGGSLTGTGGLSVTDAFAYSAGTFGNGFASLGINQTAGSLVLPSLGAAGDVILRTAGNLTLNGQVSSANGDIAVAAGGDFINNAGSMALSTPNGRWLVYSANPASSSFGGLDSGNRAIWGKTFASYDPESVVESGNRYLFAWQPTLTFTGSAVNKTYGTNLTGIIGGTYTVSGLHPGVSGAFAADTAASAYSGAPSVTSAGAAANAPVSGSPYAISVANGTLAVLNGYQLAFANGSLTINPLAVTLAGSRVYDATTDILGTSLAVSNLLAGDNVSISGSGTLASKNAGNQAITGFGTLALSNSNYTLTGATGTASITPAALTLAAATDSKVYDASTASVGAVNVNGLKGSDTVSGLSQSFASKNVLGSNNSTLQVNAGYAVNDGNGGNNYNVSTQTAAGTITPATLTLSASADSKTFDGTTVSSAAPLASGLQGSDTVSGLTQGFDSHLVGSRTLSVTGYAVNDGNGGGNYSLNLQTASGNILADPTNFIWINAAGGNWESASNWNQGVVPVDGSQVLLPTTIGGVNYNSTSNIKAITSSSNLSINGGTLKLGTSQGDTSSFATGTTVTINGGTLGGIGTLIANVLNNSGTVSAGASPGLLSINGNYVQGPGGTLLIELGGLTPGSGYDVLQISGTASLNGSMNVSLYGEFVPANGNSFTVINALGGITGTFASTNLPAGYNFTTNYGLNSLVLGLGAPANPDNIAGSLGPVWSSALEGVLQSGGGTFTGLTIPNNPSVVDNTRSADTLNGIQDLFIPVGSPFASGLASGKFVLEEFDSGISSILPFVTNTPFPLFYERSHDAEGDGALENLLNRKPLNVCSVGGL